MPDLTQGEAFAVFVGIVVGVLYLVDRLWRRLPPHDPPHDNAGGGPQPWRVLRRSPVARTGAIGCVVTRLLQALESLVGTWAEFRASQSDWNRTWSPASSSRPSRCSSRS